MCVAMPRYAHYPKLWLDADKDRDQRNCDGTATADTSEHEHLHVGAGGKTESFLRARSVPSTDLVALEVQRPPPRDLMDIINNSMVVGQEFVLASLFLARHRDAIEEWEEDKTKHEESKQQILSMAPAALVIMLILYNSQLSPDQKIRCISAKGRRKRMLVRVSDAVILAAILRFLASVLRTLTASYSSDTVNALAIGAMVVHLLACDYPYALGITAKGNGGDGNDGHSGSSRLHIGRPTFLGGTVSLNAALFSTTLLASRLPTNAMSYAFISSSVVLFAFYPAARHAIATRQSQSSKYVVAFAALFVHCKHDSAHSL